jgi:tRNA threonylcarbamoyladenosine biosynthesis protein TsaE
VDLYRIEHFSDLVPLGLNETIRNECCIIEWPDRLGPLMPKRYISVSLDFVSANPHDDTEVQALWRDISIHQVGG